MAIYCSERDTYVEPNAPRFESFDGDAFHNPIAAHAASEIDDEPHRPARGICTAVAIVAALGLLVFGGPVVWHLIARVFA